MRGLVTGPVSVIPIPANKLVCGTIETAMQRLLGDIFCILLTFATPCHEQSAILKHANDIP